MREILEVRPSLVAKNFMSHRQEDGSLKATKPLYYMFLHQHGCEPFDFDAINLNEKHDIAPEVPELMKILDDGKTILFNGLKFELSDEPDPFTKKVTRVFSFVENRKSIKYLLFVPGHVTVDPDSKLGDKYKNDPSYGLFSVANIFGKLTFAFDLSLINEIISAEEIECVNNNVERVMMKPQQLMLYHMMYEDRDAKEPSRYQEIVADTFKIIANEGFSFNKDLIKPEQLLFQIKDMMEPDDTNISSIGGITDGTEV